MNSSRFGKLSLLFCLFLIWSPQLLAEPQDVFEIMTSFPHNPETTQLDSRPGLVEVRVRQGVQLNLRRKPVFPGENGDLGLAEYKKRCGQACENLEIEDFVTRVLDPFTTLEVLENFDSYYFVRVPVERERGSDHKAFDYGYIKKNDRWLIGVTPGLLPDKDKVSPAPKDAPIPVARPTRTQTPHEGATATSGPNEQRVPLPPKADRPTPAPVRGLQGFPHPLCGCTHARCRMTSPYGVRMHPTLKRRRMHNGIDLAAPRNTPVKSVAPGKVIFVGWRGGYGRVVQVEHEGPLRDNQGRVQTHGKYVTQYSHLHRYNVKRGQKVKTLDTIGFIGSTGRSTGNHLDFEVRYKGRRHNPKHMFWNWTANKGARYPSCPTQSDYSSGAETRR